MKTQTYKAMPGDTIFNACVKATHQACSEDCTVTFDFNGITCTATAATVPAELAQWYNDEMQRLSDIYRASPEYKQQQEEWARKQKIADEARAAALVDAPANMTLRDAAGWQTACAANQDSYGGAVMTYAERWARMMEARMAKGELIAAIADECSSLADQEGITGFMYGCAVSILSKVWIHGEALRLWHNLKVQVGNEGEKANDSGGVLNPALLSIGS